MGPCRRDTGALRREEDTWTGVALPGFWMDTFEVTNRQFKAFVDAGGYRNTQYWTRRSLNTDAQCPWRQPWRDFAT